MRTRTSVDVSDILIVDDKPENLLSLEAILESSDVNCIRATSGPEALEACLRAKPALIILDVQMPGMSGFEVARHLRSLERTRGIPIIFVTATHREEKFTFEGFESGAVDYLFKPLNAVVVRSKVRVFVELHQKSLRLEQTVRELSLVNKELESFSYAVSHDLKAPVRSMVGFAGAGLEDAQGPGHEKVREYFQRVVAAGQRMNQLIESLLSLSRVTRSPLDRLKLDLSQMAAEIADELKQERRGPVPELLIGAGIEAFADKKLMEIVLRNLLSNAFKFTAKTAAACIEFGLIRNASEAVYFVRDNGAGFDMAHVNKLFGAFQRLHVDDEYPGTGIGLATVQRVIHRHGGRIWAEGSPEHGATFYFTLS